MFILVKLFFGGLLKKLMELLSFLFRNPIILCTLVGLGLGFGGGWYYKMSDAERKVKAMEKTLLDIVTAAAKEAKLIKDESKLAQDELQLKIDNLRVELNETAVSYETEIARMKANPKVKIVQVKVQTDEGTKDVELMFEGGKQVCRRLPSAFKDKVNEAVTKAEGVLK